MNQLNEISILNIITIPLFLFHRLLTNIHEVGELDYSTGIKNIKVSRLLTDLLLFPLLVVVFLVKYPHTINIIARCTAFLFLALSVYGVCHKYLKQQAYLLPIMEYPLMNSVMISQ